MASDAVISQPPPQETVSTAGFPTLVTEARLFWGLMALIAFVPLPLGSNRPVWWSLMAIWAGVLFLGHAYLRWRSPTDDYIAARKVLAIVVPFFLATAWACIQVFPWMPEALAHPIWAETRALLDGPAVSMISVNPYETVTGIMRWLTYAAIFWLALQLGRDPSFAQLGIKAIVYISLVYGAYGVIVHLGGWERILWFDKWAYQGYLTSTFVNRNSYATYAGIGLLCTTALLLQSVGSIMRSQASLRTKIELSVELMTGSVAYLVIGFVVLSTAILLTGSRAGVTSTFIGIVFLILCFGYTRVIPRQQTAALIGIVVALSLIFLAISGGTVIDRLSDLERNASQRSDIYELTIAAIQTSPWVGTGLGTFSDAYNIFRDAALPAGPTWQDAHNSYLENAMELGIPAALLLFVAVASMGELCLFGMIRRRRARIYAPIGIAILALVGVHSLFDFSLEIPAVTATFAFIMGISCAQSFSSKGRRRRSSSSDGSGRRRRSETPSTASDTPAPGPTLVTSTTTQAPETPPEAPSKLS